jgi:hypothetical protein
MTTFVWCFICERAFRNDGEYDGKAVRSGDRGGYWCPFCGASPMDTLDWESFIFGLAAANNYPDQPVDGCHYPLYPTA